MTKDEQTMIFELYKAHFSAREMSKILPHCYVTIQQLIRGFKAAGIRRYDRINLITGENLHDDAKRYTQALNIQ